MKNRLLFLGPPGAGKGTQAKLLCQEKNLLHLSTGDLLRKEVDEETKLGIKVKEIIQSGELVSDSIVLSVVEKNLTLENKGWVLDGFPRNIRQAESLDKLLDKIEQSIHLVLFIDIKDHILLERLLARGRDDDKESVIINRLKIYREQTSPLVDFYKTLGNLEIIDGDANIDVINTRINSILE